LTAGIIRTTSQEPTNDKFVDFSIFKGEGGGGNMGDRMDWGMCFIIVGTVAGGFEGAV
jgi:hypothetical protein